MRRLHRMRPHGTMPAGATTGWTPPPISSGWPNWRSRGGFSARWRRLRHDRVRAGRRRGGAERGAGRGGGPRFHARRRQRPRHDHRAARLRLACGRALGRSALVGRHPLRPCDARHRGEPGGRLRRQQRRHGAVRRCRPQRARREQRVCESRHHVRQPGIGEAETADDVRKCKAAHGVSVVEIAQADGAWRIVQDSPTTAASRRTRRWRSPGLRAATT